MTKQQLTLLDTPRSWRLDEHTRAIGRDGIARARAALRAGVRARAQGPPPRPAGPPAARQPGWPSRQARPGGRSAGGRAAA